MTEEGKEVSHVDIWGKHSGEGAASAKNSGHAWCVCRGREAAAAASGRVGERRVRDEPGP